MKVISRGFDPNLGEEFLERHGGSFVFVRLQQPLSTLNSKVWQAGTPDSNSPALTTQTFVPVISVLAEHGNAPFLWLVDSPDQGGVGSMISDGSGWDEGSLMSEGLWRKFADWATEFDRTPFYLDDFDPGNWDWVAFHERGLQLTRWLKEEVGDAYRVVYLKPGEDPGHQLDRRREVMADGTLVRLD